MKAWAEKADVGKDDPQPVKIDDADKVDMVQIFLKYCNRVLKLDDKEWTMDEKSEWRKAKSHMVTELMCQADVIVAHPNAFGIDKIHKNFAKKLATTGCKFMFAMEECSVLTELDRHKLTTLIRSYVREKRPQEFEEKVFGESTASIQVRRLKHRCSICRAPRLQKAGSKDRPFSVYRNHRGTKRHFSQRRVRNDE